MGGNPQKKMENRIFFCERSGKTVKVIIDPTGVILSPLYQEGIVIKKCDEQTQNKNGKD